MGVIKIDTLTLGGLPLSTRQTGGGFHTPLMAPAAEVLSQTGVGDTGL